MLEPLEQRRLLDAMIDGSGNLVVTGSASADTITLTLVGTDVVVDIQPEAFNQAFPVASITGAIGVNAGDGDDLVNVSEDITLQAFINGEGGADTMTGGGGNDEIRGGDGADLIEGGGGSDLLIGDGDTDTVTYASRLSDLNLSFDGVANDGEDAENDNIEQSVDILVGGRGNDTISAAGTAAGKALYGFDGNDTITGSDNDDRVHGGGGDDMLDGGAGDDFLLGTTGQDVMTGGDGNDWVTYYWAFSAVTVEPNGQPTSGTAREQDTVNADVENVVGSTFDDTLIGSAAANILRGLGGNDMITGNAGPDTMFGGTGDDSFFAADGEIDSIDGEGGTNTAEADPEDVLVNIT